MNVVDMQSAQDIAVADMLRKLTIEWADFETRLEATPLIRKLTCGRFELADYQAFLINLRQQVKDGALWMSRAASNIGEDHFEIRSRLMQHVVAEHRDFRMLETDYVASGGDLARIQGAEKNVGSEALSAWMFHEASRPNPFGLLGAMFIIEGLGSIKAAAWGRLVEPQPIEAHRVLRNVLPPDVMTDVAQRPQRIVIPRRNTRDTHTRELFAGTNRVDQILRREPQCRQV